MEKRARKRPLFYSQQTICIFFPRLLTAYRPIQIASASSKGTFTPYRFLTFN
nr:MAG TPA: hypothetical protein [Caudoviricetes sp.]